MLLTVLGAALAADVVASGGADVRAGVIHAPGAWRAEAGGEAEGAVEVREGAVSVDAALDVRFLLPPASVAIVPEALRVRGDVGPLWLGAGIAPAPWRVEEVDGWDTTLVTWSAPYRLLLPRSALTAEVGVGTPEQGVMVLGGLDLGPGLNLLGGVVDQITTAPILVGLHGRVSGKGALISGGVFAYPDNPSVAAQAGAILDFDRVRLSTQVVGGWNTPFGMLVQADIFPEEVATPVIRGELLGAQVGGAVGVKVQPTRWLDLKAEVGYADASPQAWVEAAVWAETKPKGRKKPKR
jgi:hypothetical protein